MKKHIKARRERKRCEFCQKPMGTDRWRTKLEGEWTGRYCSAACGFDAAEAAEQRKAMEARRG